MISAELHITVPFFDLDPMGIVWHGNYVKYFEIARANLLSKIGYSYAQMHESGYLWPIVDMHVKYLRSLELEQKLVITATIAEYTNRLKISYAIRDVATGQTLTKATTIQVAVLAATKEMCFECPSALTDKIRKIL